MSVSGATIRPMASAPDIPRQITVLDLFAGCGGLTEGFHQFRLKHMDETAPPLFRSVGAVEWDPAAAASYTMNFGAASPRRRKHPHEPTQVFCRDITGWTPPWAKGEIEVVVGGPPCQGFSGLNRNKVGAERNTLWQEFIRIVVALEPKVFVIENVDRFVRSPEFEDLKARIRSGDLSGKYVLMESPGTKPEDSEQVRARNYLLNAADYGALQARRRAIVIGVRTDVNSLIGSMRYPKREHSEAALKHRSTLEGLVQPRGTEEPWNAIDQLFAHTRELDLSSTALPGQQRSVAAANERVGPFRTDQLHFTRAPEPVSIARYRAIPPEGNRKNLRGRYWCRFDDGEEILLQKDTVYRGVDGKLVLSGSYTEVADAGVLGTRTYRVKQFDAVPHVLPGRSGRNKAEAYGVVVEDNGADRRATLVYLSTASWDKHDSGSGDVMGRLRLGRPSVTVRTEFFKPEKGRYLHPTEHRPITHYEAARLQGFPDDFLWSGSKTEIARQIGNAVPIPLGRAIAQAIYEYLRAGERREGEL